MESRSFLIYFFSVSQCLSGSEPLCQMYLMSPIRGITYAKSVAASLFKPQLVACPFNFTATLAA